ncbi:MAG: hypothetical protein DCC71_00850 [Proteobacteria bacterium]|nr:MAG: hypothetical protein DCC71_00850 [Pseudomonadota bacterium]
MTTALTIERASASRFDAAPLVIAPRFCGPPGTGNGGYVAGWLAARLGAAGAVEVTLRRPAPLGVPLFARHDETSGAALALADPDGNPIAEARAVDAAPDEPPAIPRAADIEGAPAPDFVHPFPGCFVCGPARGHGDGLRILPVDVPGAGVSAAHWTPGADLAGRGGVVDPVFVWAALDCPGYFGATLGRPREPLLLGRMTATVTRPLRAGARLRVVGWSLARDERRHTAATALVDERGRIVARSRQIWIAPRSAGGPGR